MWEYFKLCIKNIIHKDNKDLIEKVDYIFEETQKTIRT